MVEFKVDPYGKIMSEEKARFIAYFPHNNQYMVNI